MIAAVVLAAGLSRRMGRDKLLLPLQGKPMFAYTVDRVAAYGFDQRILVTNTPEIAQYGTQMGFTVVPSPDAACGMGHSVAAGTRAIRQDMNGALYLNADQPFLTADIIQTLCETFAHSGQIVVPYREGRPSSPCLFPARFFEQLKDLTGEQGGRTIWRQYSEQVCRVDIEGIAALADLDRPEDYAAYDKKEDA